MYINSVKCECFNVNPSLQCCNYFLANFQLNFAQGSQCVEPLQCIDEMVCAWEGANMTAMEPTTFFVKIGSSGGLRGYQAITGRSNRNYNLIKKSFQFSHFTMFL